jgi:hypothetical protein
MTSKLEQQKKSWTPSKLKTCASKDVLKKMKRESTMWKNICKLYI